MTEYELASPEAVESVFMERNAVALAFAALAIEHGWKVGCRFYDTDPLWPVLFVDTPYGQVSWHIPADEVPDGLPHYDGEWDGHDSVQKYHRLHSVVDARWPTTQQ